MMVKLSGQNLHAWCAAVHADNLPAMHSLADGFLRDEAAVTAGLTLPWNSGPVEGAVNRIKLLKRQCFGWAKFDLLRKRILLAS
jgi:transposase